MSNVDYSKLHSLTAKELVRALLKDGFNLERNSGAHHQFYHPDNRRVTVSYHHTGDTFKLRTLKSMIETQAQWTDEDLKRLSILK
jgi:predicted RNA binding protein YcfA (HicA-like mRNA interferase family)